MKQTIHAFTAAAFMVATSHAATIIPVTNGDFEDQFGSSPFFGAPDSFSDNVLTSWTGSTSFGFNHGAVDPATAAAQPTSGDLAAYIVGSGSIEQTLTYSINSGDTITVTFDAWKNNGTGSMTVNFAGLGAQSVDLGTGDNDITNNQIDFTATSNISSGVLRFVFTGSITQARIDTVSVEVTQVPEPSSAALLGLGGLALILRRRK